MKTKDGSRRDRRRRRQERSVSNGRDEAPAKISLKRGTLEVKIPAGSPVAAEVLRVLLGPEREQRGRPEKGTSKPSGSVVVGPQELSVWKKLADHKTVKEIVFDLNMNLATVKTHVHRLRRKFHAETLGDLVRKGKTAGLHKLVAGFTAARRGAGARKEIGK